MGEPKRIQRRRTKGWKMPPDTIVVDRATPFGNPFPISRGTQTTMGVTTPVYQIGTWDGPAMWFKDTKQEAAKISVEAFRAWLTHAPQAQLLAKVKIALRGKDLACWCPVDQPCHADVLLDLANHTKAPG